MEFTLDVPQHLQNVVGASLPVCVMTLCGPFEDIVEDDLSEFGGKIEIVRSQDFAVDLKKAKRKSVGGDEQPNKKANVAHCDIWASLGAQGVRHAKGKADSASPGCNLEASGRPGATAKQSAASVTTANSAHLLR